VNIHSIVTSTQEADSSFSSGDAVTAGYVTLVGERRSTCRSGVLYEAPELDCASSSACHQSSRMTAWLKTHALSEAQRLHGMITQHQSLLQ
jgi:hypothetical protein